MNSLNNLDKIIQAHGNGGKLTHLLINDIFYENFKNLGLNTDNDSGILDINKLIENVSNFYDIKKDDLLNYKLAFTTDSYVVYPLFFNGGDIGKLSVCGTINDLCVSGAIPLAISLGLIIEEGFEIKKLNSIIQSIAKTAKENNVLIVAGDTKVTGYNKCDGIYINTSGIGLIPNHINLHPKNIEPDDVIIITGPFGNHGMCILNERDNYVDKNLIQSDCNALNLPLIKLLFNNKVKIKAMRDPTRGGVATTLNEFVIQNKNIGIEIFESNFKFDKNVKGLADLLGIDLLYSACEGQAIIICSKDSVDEVLNVLSKFPKTSNAFILGKVNDKNIGTVVVKTLISGSRILDMQILEQFPRIC